MGRTSASATEIPPDEETRSDSSPPVLFWAESDIEQRLGFQGGRFTRCNNLLTFLMAVLLTVVFYTALLVAQGTWIAAMFTQRGATPCFIVFFSSWSLSILFIKSRKLALQVQSLRLSIVSPDHAFILSTATVDQISTRMVEMVDDPKHFVVLNRITIALSNLRNLGRVTDVDEILRSQAEHDESSMETSYSLLRGFLSGRFPYWAS